MANKRIKISELPKIVYNPVAGGTETTMTSADYLPIAVTDRTNAAIKTSMAVTTRELQRFILQQPRDLEDVSTELTIGRPGVTVKSTSLSANTLTVAGTAVVNYASVTNIQMDRISTPNGITAGPSTYPTVLRSSGDLVSYGMLVSNSNGIFTGEGTTLRTLLSIVPVTSKLNAGSLLTVAADGRISFTYDASTLLGSNNSITKNTDLYGNVLGVSTTGGVNAATGITVTAIKDAVTNVNTTLPINRDTTSHGQKFITTTNGAANLTDLSIHNSGETIESLNVRTVTDAVKITQTKLDNPTGSNLRFIVSNANAPTLGEARIASLDHMKLVTTNSPGNNAQVFNNQNSDRLNRVVMTSPIVLGAKHQDDIDLTDSTIDQGQNGPNNFVAQIGEIRWNIYNNVPTIYLAVADLPYPSGGGIEGAKIWYGIPLFGTIAEPAKPGSTGYPSTTASSVTAHEYEDVD